LRPLAGNAAYVLMALGLIGSGLLAIPILTTSGAYAVCETFGWKWGLDEKFRRAKQFYVVIAVSTLVGLLINFMDINPMDALFWAAVVNGLIAPPLLFIIMLVANNKRIMGKRVNGPGVNALGWLTTLVMFSAAVGLALTWGKS
jgi:Mn2+/Fe2+ NRAMP family transporter